MQRRRTNVLITGAATVMALWLGLTAPQVSPVAPLPAGPIPATATTTSDAVASPVSPAPGRERRP